MVVAVLGTTFSLKFLWNLELLGGIVLRRTRFVFFFVSLEEDLCPFLIFHFWEYVVNKILWIASFHKLFFKCGNVFFKCFWRVNSILAHKSQSCSLCRNNWLWTLTAVDRSDLISGFARPLICHWLSSKFFLHDQMITQDRFRFRFIHHSYRVKIFVSNNRRDVNWS